MKTQEIEVDTRKRGNTHKMEGGVSKQRGRRTTKKREVCRSKRGFLENDTTWND